MPDAAAGKRVVERLEQLGNPPVPPKDRYGQPGEVTFEILDG